MYSTREALAYTGKLPIQQNPAAITPQLLDLLALQKVEADKKAAAQQLALSSGQAQPTVAQGLQQRAMDSARQEISQKMGLAGLSQQQPPAGPMPQQPQGLMGAPTNLPTEYQGGGIIAFAAGGSGGDAHGRFRQREVEQFDMPVESEDQPPQMSAENVEFNRSVQEAALRGLNQDPEAEQQKAMEFQQSMLSPNREAAIARKREQQAGLKALYERQIAERPSDLRVALDRMAQNINAPGGYGAAMQGVSQAGQAAREGYTKQEITQLNNLSAIDDEIDKAIENNDVGKYNAGVARRKEVQIEMNNALTSGTSLANTLESAQTRKEVAFDRIQEAKRAKIAEDTRKREASATTAELKRETEARLEREFKFKYDELRQARLLAGDDRKAKMILDAREKALDYVRQDYALAIASPEVREAEVDKITAMLLKPVGKPSAAPSVGAPPPGAVRLKKP